MYTTYQPCYTVLVVNRTEGIPSVGMLNQPLTGHTNIVTDMGSSIEMMDLAENSKATV